MPTATHYDAIVIGSGQGGTPLSGALANHGLRTALVESTHVGGTCINEGCTPTKTMIASGRVAYLARRGADYGVHTGKLRITMERVRKRKRDIVNSFRGGSEKRLRNTKNLDLIFGEASFNGPRSVLVNTGKRGKPLQLTADRFFLSTGCRPAVPDVPGLAEGPFLNSTSIMELAHVPPHLIVLGGGYVGLEFAQLFRRLGSRVTVLHHGVQLLPREDADVAEAVAEILKQDGIKICLNAEPGSVRHTRDRVSVDFHLGTKRQRVEGSHLLVATGRVPNTDRLNLPAANVATDTNGFVRVNDKLETSAPGIYALGDVKGGPAFTHIAYDDFRILRTNLIEKGAATTANRFVPCTVFIDPQLGRVGITEREALARNLSIRIAKMPMTSVARALEVDESRGFLKAIVDTNTNEILGAAVLGLEGGEIMSQIQIAMMGRLPYTTLRDATFSHPTLAECLNNLFTYYFQS